MARFTPVRGRSITTPSQHVRPALRADRPRFAALLSSCAQGSALLIFSVSLCQYKCCALFLPQLAAHLSPLRRCSALYAVTPSDAPQPVGIPSVSLCRRACFARPAATVRYGRYLPAALLGALLSPPQTRSLFPPPAAVAYLPQNDRKNTVILSASDTPPGHTRIPYVGRQAWKHTLLHPEFFGLTASE